LEHEMNKYRLTVSGIVRFHDDGRDQILEDRLKGLEGGERFNLAIQELEEGATNITVSMEKED